MGIYSIKPKFQQILVPFVRFAVRNKISPDAINFLGLLCSVALGFVIFYSNKDIRFLVLIPILAFVRTAFNALDGLVSRGLGVDSKWGEVLNEFLDRVSDAFIFFSLAFAPFMPGYVHYLGAVVAALILLGSYAGILSKAVGLRREYGGFMGKADRMFWLGTWAIVIAITGRIDFWQYLIVFVGLGMIQTLTVRIITIKKSL